MSLFSSCSSALAALSSRTWRSSRSTSFWLYSRSSGASTPCGSASRLPAMNSWSCAGSMRGSIGLVM